MTSIRLQQVAAVISCLIIFSIRRLYRLDKTDAFQSRHIRNEKTGNESEKDKLDHQKFEIKENNLVNRETIRRWGCARNETPFIFVHIGKAGGGEVRRMFAAAALNYTSHVKEKNFIESTSFYAVHFNNSDSTVAKAKFTSSSHRNSRPERAMGRSFEGSVKCDAETPIGQAVCFDNYKSRCPKDDDGDPRTRFFCHLVYVGHNMLGNEMHWLPNGYLERWWDSSLGNRINGVPFWSEITNRSICEKPNDKYCKENMTSKVDRFARQAFSPVNAGGEDEKHVSSYAPLYASMPVLRVTMLRDPFSWLASKYLWHGLGKKNLTHDNLEEMTRSVPDGFVNMFKKMYGPGWANHVALKYIMQLCGEDCLVRYVHGRATLKDIERQAEENLRHSYAVVGLLTETQSFYDMISARVTYMANLTNNAHLVATGGSHKTKNSEVKTLYANLTFQAQLIDASPEVAALLRLYKVAIEVNRFQLSELKACPTWDPH